ncbi:MAG: aminotransferase class III-fold pyridoxal phosphate-dependent enzyme [Pyrinomonadaceae bacterium]
MTVSTEFLRDALKADYGITVSAFHRLGGYDSVNYRVDTDSGQLVAKIYPEEASADEVMAEIAIAKKIALKLPDAVQAAVPTLAGGKFSRLTDGRILGVLEFLEGEFIGDGNADEKESFQIGEFLGRIDESLFGFESAALKARAQSWDLRNSFLVKPKLEFIGNGKKRSLARYFLNQFLERLAGWNFKLRRSYIHGDAHGENILRMNDGEFAIIDYGDACHSFLLSEIAIAATYRMFGSRDPIGAAVPAVAGYSSVVPLTEEECDAFFYFVGARLASSVCHSAEAKTEKPHDEYIARSEAGAWELMERLIETGPVDTENRIRTACGHAPRNLDDTALQFNRRSSTTSTALSLQFSRPIHMKSAAFQYMYDISGNAYLDCYNNIPQVGHCHPVVVEAGQRAMSELNTNTRYLNDTFNRYSERLLARFPRELDRVFFVNSGSAATDLALRLGEAFIGSNSVAAMEFGYHGNTRAAIEVSHYKFAGKGGKGTREDVYALPIPDRFKAGIDESETTQIYLEKARDVLEGKGSLTFIAEPIVGCGGQVPLSSGYLEGIYAMVRGAGGITISDEVQTGFGRLGKHFWGFEMHGVVPDIVVLGKPIANGHPMGAVVTSRRIAEAFETGMEFFSSFGGNPVSCSIAEAVLDVLEAEKLPENAEIVGHYLFGRLEELRQRFASIGDVRGGGLFLGVEMVVGGDPQKPATALVGTIKDGLRDSGILVGSDGPSDNVLKIKPPLCFTKQNADRFVENLDSILEKHEQHD